MSSQTAPMRLLPQPVIYPVREERVETWIDRLEGAVTSLPVRSLPAWRKLRFRRMIDAINARASAVSAMDEAGLRAEAAVLREQLKLCGFRRDLVVRSFALVREAATRSIGLRHYDVQLMGGLALLNGMVAEMETGEGKTLTATLAAATAAFSGMPVHVVTVNDYLAERDAAEMGPIFRSLGLTVATVVHGLAPEQRQAAYAADITYCCNKELTFDYLRDRIVLGSAPGNLHLKLERLYASGSRSDRLMMRGLPFAIVDEVDSILVDEARTPLIISGETQPEEERLWAEQALKLAASLTLAEDFRIVGDERRVEITKSGRKRLAEQGQELGGPWRGRIHREQSVRQALAALNLFRRGEHYLVRDDRIQIVDEYTGRIMAERTWNDGLHQLVEAKEGCPVTGRKVTLARTSYQRFFRRYRLLAGMTGTAREVAGELWAVYRLATMAIPTNRPMIRKALPARICRTLESKWDTIVERTRDLQATGQPVLIGTRSVAASETVSQRLTAAGIEHEVLSAAHDQHEAEIIAVAGARGRVTVATNMAGRGVDIRLGEDVAALGGLHVILSERHDAGRIDRQLAGRCGRQGDPGCFEPILSLEDPLLESVGRFTRLGIANLAGPLRLPLLRVQFRRAQRRVERLHSRIRRDLLRADQDLGAMLAFSGERE